MKAWIVNDYNGESGSVIVFANTRGKAKYIAMHSGDTFADYEWIEIRAHRFKEWDSHYKGNACVNFWRDDQSRIELVRDFGWSCLDPYYEECKICPASEYCDYGRRYSDEISIS